MPKLLSRVIAVLLISCLTPGPASTTPFIFFTYSTRSINSAILTHEALAAESAFVPEREHDDLTSRIAQETTRLTHTDSPATSPPQEKKNNDRDTVYGCAILGVAFGGIGLIIWSYPLAIGVLAILGLTIWLIYRVIRRIHSEWRYQFRIKPLLNKAFNVAPGSVRWSRLVLAHADSLHAHLLRFSENKELTLLVERPKNLSENIVKGPRRSLRPYKLHAHWGKSGMIGLIFDLWIEDGTFRVDNPWAENVILFSEVGYAFIPLVGFVDSHIIDKIISEAHEVLGPYTADSSVFENITSIISICISPGFLGLLTMEPLERYPGKRAAIMDDRNKLMFLRTDVLPSLPKLNVLHHILRNRKYKGLFRPFQYIYSDSPGEVRARELLEELNHAA
jgi:hypothetical protein